MAQLLIKGTKVAEVVGDTTSLIANTLYHPSGTQIITDDGGTVGLTNVSLHSINFDNVANNAISGDKIHGGTISGSQLHTDVTFADVNSSVVNDSISGDKIHGGTISGFQSTGIADNASSTALTISSDGDITIGGDIVPLADNSYDLGLAGTRWANVYTNDLHLSNEGKEGGNEIDGTTGNWTIQEGSDDLYVLNNKNGRRYKFTLQDI